MYSLPYILLFLTLMGLALLNKHVKAAQRPWVVFAAYFIMFLFFGFRGFIGDDWQEYYPFFTGCKLSDLTFSYYMSIAALQTYEPGFCLLALVCKAICNEFVFFQAVCNIINLILLHFFLRRTVKNENLGIAVFLIFGGYVMMTNLMRNAIAILLIANAFRFVEEEKPLRYIALCLVAGLFHFSAVLCVPLYWVLRIKTGKWGFLAFAVISNLIFLLHIEWFTSLLSSIAGEAASLLTDKATAYANNYERVSVISIGFLERTATTVFLFFYYDRIIEQAGNRKIFLNLFLLYLFLFLGFWENSALGERVSYLMIPAYWVLWPSLEFAFKTKGNRKFLYIFIAVYGALKLVGQTNSVSCQYDNHLFWPRTYEERQTLHQTMPDTQAKPNE